MLFVNGLQMVFIELRNSIPSQAGECFLETIKHLLDRAKLESIEVFIALVDKMIARDGLTFILRDRTELRVNRLQ